MKKIFSSLFISLFLISLFLVSTISVPNSTNLPFLKSTSVEQNKNSSKDIALKNSITIANVLIRNAIPDNKSGLKWNKYFNYTGTDASKFYYGYGYGAAGIGDFFVNLYNETLNTTYINIALQAFEFINAHVTTNGSIIYWTRSEDAPYIYIGYKYGNAGIADFLLSLYLNTHNNSVLLLAEKSLDSLIKMSINAKSVDPNNYGIYWGYSPGADAIADILYGNAGIASSFIKAYTVTKNQTYLSVASEALYWILSQSAVTDNSTTGKRYIRYSPSPVYPFAFTGFLSGASGIGETFLQYYSATKNSEYLLIAQQIGNWLISEEKNGFWTYGGVDLLTNNADSAGSYTGYGAGSAGIGIFLLDLYSATHEVKYISAVKQIMTMFSSYANINSNNFSIPIQIDKSNPEIYSSDLTMGLSGIGLFLSKLYYYFGINESLNYIDGIMNNFGNLTDSNGIIPTQIGIGNSSLFNYDLSYFEGLTGIGFFYLNTYKSLKSTIVYNSTVYYQLATSKKSVPGFETLTLITILYLSIQRKRKTKLLL